MPLFDILNFQVLDADSCDSRYDDLIFDERFPQIGDVF